VASLVALAAASAHLPTLAGYFRADDFGYVQLYWPQPSTSWAEIMGRDFFESQSIWAISLYELRPLDAMLFRLNTWVSGVEPAGYHAVNILLHVLATLLVLWVARALLRADWPTAGVVALLFGVLPVHAEPVAWIATRADVLVTALALATLLCFHVSRTTEAGRSALRTFLWGSLAVLFYALALLTKESALTLVLLILGWDRLTGPSPAANELRRLARRILPYLFVLVAVVALRLTANVPVLPDELTDRATLLEFADRQLYYLKSLTIPTLRLIDPPAPAGPSGWTRLGIGLLAACSALSFYALLAPRRLTERARAVICFGPFWWVATMLPLIAANDWSERHLYLPSAGLCLALASLGWPTGRWPRRLAAGGAITALSICWIALLSRQLEAVETERMSRSFHTVALEAAGRATPGSHLLLLPPLHAHGRWVWQWALPFAMQPPFATRDVYETLQVVESPGAYCCPESVWWRDRRTSFRTLLEDPGGDTIVVRWDPARDGATDSSVSRERLRQLLVPQRPLGRITLDEAARLLEQLASAPTGQ
jgi:hypothetical protein